MRMLAKSATVALSILGLLLATTTMCLAHRDLVLTISKDGTIPYLPKAYAPAKLDIHFTTGKNGVRRIDAFRIRIGTHETSLPACLIGILDTPDMKHIQALGSTINDPNFTRLFLKFYGPDYDPENFFNNYVTLEFSLRSAKLIAVTKAEVGSYPLPSLVASKNKDGQTTVQLGDPIYKGPGLEESPVDVGALCPHANLNRFLHLNGSAK